MKKVLQQLKQYKRDTFLCIALTGLEVIMEILLPFVTSLIIDRGLSAGNLPTVYRYGILMVVMAFLSLAFGAIGGKYAASASSGLAANLRESIYRNIQTFSFSNIDKFSVPGLVTRMTTDTVNEQFLEPLLYRVKDQRGSPPFREAPCAGASRGVCWQTSGGEQAGQQGDQGQADEGDAAPCHKLFYP